MQEEQLIPIVEDKQKESIIPLPTQIEQKENSEKEIIKELPSWSIEPPIEIKRGNQ